MSTHGGPIGAPPAAPNEVHPAYADNAAVNDWVNGAGPYAGRHRLLLPILPVFRFADVDSSATSPDLGAHTLALHTCWGAAPYVGRPFVYVWKVAMDELGRMVAGEAWRQYLDVP